LLDDKREFGAVTNIGVRPTFGVLGRTLEAHIFDFSDDIYGRALRVTFLSDYAANKNLPVSMRW
jgi:riboflavin kinase/FMN adenylyltransferase